MAAPKVDATTMTAMQELASAWIFKRAIQDGQNFTSVEDIKTGNPKDRGETYDEIINIWISSSKGKIKNREEAVESLEEGGWLENFYKQSGLLVKKVGKRYDVFTRGKTDGYMANWYPSGDTFMEWVAKKVKNEFKIQRKDNWNPADVWLIKDVVGKKNFIDNAMRTPIRKGKVPGGVEANLNQFNAIFRKWFKTKEVMGISLKKVSGNAVWKEVNVEMQYFKGLDSVQMEYTGATCKFGPGVVTEAQEERGRRKLELPTKAGTFALETQETMIYLKDKDSGTEYQIQIKANDPSKWDNLKYEPKEVRKSASRLGKATSAYVDDLAELYGWGSNWKRSWQDYPQSLATPTKFPFTEAQQKKYLTKITFLQSQGVKIGNVTPLEAVINIKETFRRTSQPQTANSKLMQVTWLYNLMKMTDKNRDKMLTDMIFLAEKKGRRYGPYGKIY